MNQNFQTSGEGDKFLVFLAQALNKEDAAAYYDSLHNGDNIPLMPEAGGGGTAYVESVGKLSPSQRQTYDSLVIWQSLIIPILILCIAVKVFTNRHRRIRRGNR